MAGGFTTKYREFFPLGSEDVWIETGTYRGSSTARALEMGFRELHTIEVSAHRFTQLEADNPELCIDLRVHRYLGSSRDCLRPIVKEMSDRNVVFWLDGHYQGESQDERDTVSECPMLDEVKAIVEVPWRKSVVVCIDDYNLFTDAYWERGEGREKFTPLDWPREINIAEIMHDWRSSNEDHVLYFYR